MANNKIAIILIRGMIGIHPDVKKTLELFRLHQKHACVVVEDNSVSRGMLQKVKDYVTYGEVDEEFFKEMIDKRGEIIGKKKAIEVKLDSKKVANEYFSGKLKLRDFEAKYQLKPFFRLHPPIGGFERKGIKMPYTKGGVLGNRADKIKVLISKML